MKSLISLPCFMSHASIPAAVREARGLTEDLVRISVGIEDANDLIADLDHALKTGHVWQIYVILTVNIPIKVQYSN